MPSYNNAEQGAKSESGNKLELVSPAVGICVGVNRFNLLVHWKQSVIENNLNVMLWEMGKGKGRESQCS